MSRNPLEDAADALRALGERVRQTVGATYRDLGDAETASLSSHPISEREARIVSQVLLVIIRDLDPGR